MTPTLATVTEVGAEDILRRLRQFARRPAVVGIVVTGSRGKGFGGPDSDVDAYVVFEEGASDADLAEIEALACDRLDLTVVREEAFARLAAWGEADAWNRYDFAHVPPLVDRDDRLRALAADKGNLPAGVARQVAEAALDAFLNAAYRSEKAEGRERPLAARLEALAAVQPLLTFVFAAEGRLVPWPDYLERELATFPLQDCTLSGEALVAAIVAVADGHGDARRRLVRSIVAYADAAGFASIIEGWRRSQIGRMESDAPPVETP